MVSDTMSNFGYAQHDLANSTARPLCMVPRDNCMASRTWYSHCYVRKRRASYGWQATSAIRWYLCGSQTATLIVDLVRMQHPYAFPFGTIELKTSEDIVDGATRGHYAPTDRTASQSWSEQ